MKEPKSIFNMNKESEKKYKASKEPRYKGIFWIVKTSERAKKNWITIKFLENL